jgi:hypothetical protein
MSDSDTLRQLLTLAIEHSKEIGGVRESVETLQEEVNLLRKGDYGVRLDRQERLTQAHIEALKEVNITLEHLKAIDAFEPERRKELDKIADENIKRQKRHQMVRKWVGEKAIPLLLVPFTGALAILANPLITFIKSILHH